MNSENIIEINNLSFSYGENQVLKDVNLTLPTSTQIDDSTCQASQWSAYNAQRKREDPVAYRKDRSDAGTPV